MNDGDILGVGTGDSVDGRELTDTESGDKGGQALGKVSLCNERGVQRSYP